MPWWLWSGGLALAFAQVAWASRRAALFQDDFIFLGQARIDGVHDGVVLPTRLTWDYLSKALFEHFSPVTRLLFWTLGKSTDPRLVGRIMVLSLVALVVVAFGELTRAVLGRTIAALLVAMIATQALVLTRLAAWTTASFNILPAVAFTTLSLTLAYRYLHDPTKRAAAAGSVVFYGLAVLDYEFAMLLPLFVLAWFLLCLAPELGRSATIARLRATAVYWISLGIIGVAAAVNYRLNYYIDTLPRGSAGSTLRTLWYSLLQGLFPAILGVYSPTAGNFGVATVLVCVAWIVIVSAAVVFGGGPAVRAVVFGAFAWLVCNLLLAYGRSAVNGVGIGIELYYAGFPMLFVTLAACEAIDAVRRRRLAAAPAASIPTFLRTVDPSNVVVVVLALGLVASAIGLQANADTLTSVKGVARFAGDFSARFLEDVESADSPPHVLSLPAPEWSSTRSSTRTTGHRGTSVRSPTTSCGTASVTARSTGSPTTAVSSRWRSRRCCGSTSPARRSPTARRSIPTAAWCSRRRTAPSASGPPTRWKDPGSPCGCGERSIARPR